MAKKRKKTAPSKRVVPSKLTRDDLERHVKRQHAKLKTLIHRHLESAGLLGVRLHSLRFSVTETKLAGPGCDPPCPSGARCVLDSNGGVVQWVCI